MEIRKQKKVTEKKYVTVGYKCDNCGKEIKGSRRPKEWHHFSSHHNEWGNDSIDSYEHYTVCSPKCYVEKLIKVVDSELSGRYDAEIDDMSIQFARRMVEFFKSK